MDNLHAKQGYIYIIGCTARLGSLRFATRLEYDQYPPDTPLNDSYNLFHTFYNSVPFYIIEIPNLDYQNVQKLAQECNLKLVPGKPCTPGTDSFGLACNAESCFTLETLDYTDLEQISSEDMRALLKTEYDEARNLLK